VVQLQPVGYGIWTYEGSTVSFYGFPFPTRMCVIRLPGNRLWIHSPEKVKESLQQELQSLGEVAYLVSPNKLHHLFLDEWLECYPDALSYAAPGLIEKRRDLHFDGELGDKEKARAALRTMLAWQPENIILSHGRCIFGNGAAFLEKSFSWLAPME